MIDTLIIITNGLVVLSSVAVAFVTMADVNREEQKTLRDVVHDALLRPSRTTEPKRGTLERTRHEQEAL